MPPKTKISREMIIDAAFEIAREQGIQAVNARTTAKKLGCSTQPILYCFATIEDLKKAVFEKADKFQTEFLMNLNEEEDPIIQIGLLYVDFAYQEKNLFKLLFQTDSLGCKDIMAMLNHSELEFIFSMISQSANCSEEEAKSFFLSKFFLVHGLASLMCNNIIDFDKELIKKIITGDN